MTTRSARHLSDTQPHNPETLSTTRLSIQLLKPTLSAFRSPPRTDGRPSRLLLLLHSPLRNRYDCYYRFAHRWPSTVPITLLDFETGVDIHTGLALRDGAAESNPCRFAYVEYCRPLLPVIVWALAVVAALRTATRSIATVADGGSTPMSTPALSICASADVGLRFPQPRGQADGGLVC